MSAADPTPARASVTAAGKPGVRRVRALLLWGVPAVAVLALLYAYASGGRYVSTDNAYLKQDRVDVAPQIAGDVREVHARENQPVRPGQVVLVLDDALLRVAVARAEAELASARLEVRSLQAAYREKQGEVQVAKATSHYALRELGRQRELAARQLVPASTLDATERQKDIAVGTIAVLELQLAQARARLGDPALDVDRHPQVLRARAELDRARVDLEHAAVRAPRAGIASHLPFVGDRVEAGRAAFSIVADGGLYVEANFKETDLEWVRPGQEATVELDLYPGHEWHGRVASIAQATGAEFSLLPPQNASGNWVKVVQRIPVRIAIDRRADDPPLRSGASALVVVDTGPRARWQRWFGRRS